MTEIASLLGSTIYEIQEAWTGWDELQHANHVLRALPKGLKFFWAVSPSESPKVMGLVGINYPDALWHFNGVTYCPWCRKEGQNEGIIINHLRTVHYKLGLICEKCFCCPSITSEAIQHHRWKNCQPSVEGRSWGVILISVTTGRKYARSTFPWWEPGQRIWGRTWHLSAHLIRDTPLPHQYELRRRIRGRTHCLPTQHIPIT